MTPQSTHNYRPTHTPDHLFVSYAAEDWPLAQWLTLRLTAAGYRVWCDRFEMLGGESFPEHIDTAIKTQTFRMLALLSQYSMYKPNCVGERQTALNIERATNTEFLIPLNVDGFSSTDLAWNISYKNYIPFQAWADGLAQLLKKLRSISAPRPIESGGRLFAVQAARPKRVVIPKSEELVTNLLPVTTLPSQLTFVSTPAVECGTPSLDHHVAAFRLTDDLSVGFSPHASPPPGDSPMGGSFPIEGTASVLGVPTEHILPFLVGRTIRDAFRARGLTLSPDRRYLHFPLGLLPDEKVHFINLRGKTSWLLVAGERTFQRRPYRYHLAVDPTVRTDICPSTFTVVLRPRVFLADAAGHPLSPPAAVARRKALTRGWFNAQWRNRVLALASHIASSGAISVGPPGHALVLPACPITLTAPFSINEQRLRALRAVIEVADDDIDDVLYDDVDTL